MTGNVLLVSGERPVYDADTPANEPCLTANTSEQLILPRSSVKSHEFGAPRLVGNRSFVSHESSTGCGRTNLLQERSEI